MNANDARAGAPPIEVVAGILERRGRYLVAKRPDHGQLPSVWEFPGGKVETGESLEKALVREFMEELGIAVVVGRHIVSSVHHYPRGAVRLSGFQVLHESGTIELRAHQDLRWVAVDELRTLNLAPADLSIVEALEAL